MLNEIITLSRQQYQSDLQTCAIKAIEEYEQRKAKEQAKDGMMPVRVVLIAKENGKGVKRLQRLAKEHGLVVNSRPMTIYRKDKEKLLAA
jgi:hypothetical protein